MKEEARPMKQEMSSVDVAALVQELNPRLYDAKIGKIYQNSENEIRLRLYIFKETEGRQDLVIEAGRRIHLTNYPEESPRFPQSFPMLLRKHLTGGRIQKVLQYDFDRIVEIHIQRGGVDTILLAELFARGNIVLLDSEKRIILPLRSISYRDRKIRGGEPYELPAPQLSPLDVTEGDLKVIFSGSDSDVVRTIATRMNIGGQFAEEICIRAGITKNKPAKQLSDSEIVYILKAISNLFEPIRTKNFKPHIVKKNKQNEDVLPFELRQYDDHEKQYFGTFNEALDEYFSKKIIVKKVEQVQEKKDERIGLFEYRLKKQQASLDQFRKEERSYVKKGEMIYSEYGTINEIVNTIRNARDKGYPWDEIKATLKQSAHPAARIIKDIDPAKGTAVLDFNGERISIDISLSIPQNAQAYYEKAKKISSKIEGAIKAIEDTKEIMKKEKDEIPQKRKAAIDRKKRWFEQFRWFYSSDGFLVIGGRDSQSNEDIVKKYMEKRDIFFHAHVSGSPAVIIKTEGKEVPETTLREAAEFTVSYSSVWKEGHASGECYWVLPDQVSKTPEHGEYLPKGAFAIRGKRNYMSVPVGVAIGVEVDGQKHLAGGPVSAVKKQAKYIFEIEPGEFNQNDLAAKIYRELNLLIEDKKLIKAIASPDKIAMFLPPGGSRVRAKFVPDKK